MTHQRRHRALFDLGQIVATPAALAVTSHEWSGDGTKTAPPLGWRLQLRVT
jgi:hypothetical protein